MKNIFENAYFGKAYKTRDGRKAIYHMYDSVESTYFLILDGSDEVCCDDEGIDLGAAPEYDIISEWQEPINEEKLEELAEAYSSSIDKFPLKWFTKEHIKTLVECAYMVGYETAKKGE